MTRRRPIPVTPDVALSVVCPVCKAGPGSQCRDRAGARGIHLERFQVVDSWNRLQQVSLSFEVEEGLFA